MKTACILFFAVILMGCTQLMLSKSPAQQSVQQNKEETKRPLKWEYKILIDSDVGKVGGDHPGGEYYYMSTDAQEKGLNKLAEDGWELVYIRPVLGGKNLWYYFKRAKQ